MPELPEVEIVARSLSELVEGLEIAAAALHREKLAPAFDPKEFARLLSGGRIDSVGRRGKHILFELSSNRTLIVHLRMSGKFVLLEPHEPNPKFTHAELFFPDERRLVFEDQRHFGYMNIAETDHVSDTPEISKLAPEPFSDDFNREYLTRVLSQTRRPIKDVLLDQSKVCGLGNIYAAESMFLARVNPAVPANRISAIKTGRLFTAIRHVLRESIEQGLKAMLDRTNIENRYFNGSSNGSWLVYDREGQPCVNCGRALKRMKQSGRSTVYCPRCQRK
ncbi:MAG: bifunctional DNA-formamidopyrimidine glycosylase/DNA-(apurinic or apyrimidinic site) lyase [Acidobacteria bacterium]|nr:MAG: bifunctional DNA-formamidopyrimidine glycosylase/DNA-(apurinic or apyrimidinic site) lyase [Acidobacteriota bacterium]REK01940.1 MAG: bifunctional DNA-formamidopyrimidine glycosylase/DNA-(apurinic or apyrimidinic site) lyase [Acidobacteriota bacterium]REK14896.1 MAG: bifunctional DNA-formamidopyrimidine glycosylase/DNA-(apurinic or apyrimidinic site) lyase [Acidobacteriota bacterium]REK45611.1 MAG: bifunctional DNA-formamidopyrimidine glycosylase/DNA-(apurinic or apyrimidinic site) lyase